MYFCWDACLLGLWHIKKKNPYQQKVNTHPVPDYVTSQNLDVGIADVQKLLFM